MNKVHIGSVYEKDLIKYVLIKFDQNKNYCQFIPFNDSMIIGAPIESVDEEHLCSCGWEDDTPDADCETCRGTGVYRLPPKIVFSDFVFVAHSIRAYLIQKFVD